MIVRHVRQTIVAEWCERCFGAGHASSLPQRGIRLLEEAVEAYQSAGGDRDSAHRLIDFIFERPSGQLGQELGGVAVTLLALAAAAGLSADEEEVREITRVLSKDANHFRKRNEAKNAAGFDLTGQAYPTSVEAGQ